MDSMTLGKAGSGSKSGGFAGKIDKLQAAYDDAKKKMSSKGVCVPTIALIALLTPVITFLITLIANPSFVRDDDGSRNYKLISTITLAVSGLTWAGLVAFAYKYGMDSLSVVCISF